MTTPLRIGVIGTGGWGTHVAEQFRDNPDATVVALADVDGGSREAAGETLGVGPEHRYEDAATMLDAETLDAVQVTSPHALHYDHVVAAMDRGLHVLCEKPLVPGVEQAADLVRRAASGPTLMVGYQRHVSGPYVRAREAIATGEVRPAFVTAEITQPWIENVGGTWRVDPDLSGGGQLYDSGSHLLDAVCWLLDERPTRITAEMAFHDGERVDTQAALTVRFEGGTVAAIGVSGDSPDVTERIAVRGDGGRVLIRGEGWTDRAATITDAEGATQASVEGELSTYDKVDAFLRSIREGGAPPATARHALHAIAATEAAYESARTGRRVDVELDG